VKTQFQIVKGKAGCEECGGTGWLRVSADDSVWKICACAGHPEKGVFLQSHKERIEQQAAGNEAMGSALDGARALLAKLICEGTCPAGRDPASERALFAALRDAWGESRAVPRSYLEQVTGLGEREVKSLVEHLVLVHRLSELGLVMGRSRGGRGGPHGCYWCTSVEEAMRSAEPYLRQIITSLHTLDAWVGRLGPRPKLRQAIAELSGQYRLFAKRSAA